MGQGESPAVEPALMGYVLCYETRDCVVNLASAQRISAWHRAANSYAQEPRRSKDRIVFPAPSTMCPDSNG